MSSDPYDPFSRERELLASGVLDPPENAPPVSFKQKIAPPAFFVISVYLIARHGAEYALGFNAVIMVGSLVGMRWVKYRAALDR